MKCFSTNSSGLRAQGSEIKKRFISKKVFILSAFCVVKSELSVFGCPLCKEAISKVSGLARGFYWSILLMLGVPALLVTIISGYLFKTYWRSR